MAGCVQEAGDRAGQVHRRAGGAARPARASIPCWCKALGAGNELGLCLAPARRSAARRRTGSPSACGGPRQVSHGRSRPRVRKAHPVRRARGRVRSPGRRRLAAGADHRDPRRAFRAGVGPRVDPRGKTAVRSGKCSPGWRPPCPAPPRRQVQRPRGVGRYPQGRVRQLVRPLRRLRPRAARPRGHGHGPGNDAQAWALAHDAERLFHGTPSGVDTGLSMLGGTCVLSPHPPGLPGIQEGPAPRALPRRRVTPQGRGLRGDRRRPCAARAGPVMPRSPRQSRSWAAFAAEAADCLLSAAGSPAAEIGALADKAMRRLRALGLSTRDLDLLLYTAGQRGRARRKAERRRKRGGVLRGCRRPAGSSPHHLTAGHRGAEGRHPALIALENCRALRTGETIPRSR